jgi:hypothetical protein
MTEFYRDSGFTTFDQAKGPLVHEEVVLKLGTGHGTFFRPGDWLGRAADWVKQARK